MRYYIDYDREKWNSAGVKAPRDIADICKSKGFRRVCMPYFSPKLPSVIRLVLYFFALPYKWAQLSHSIGYNDIVVYQHPMYSTRISVYEDHLARFFISRMQKKKGCKFIAVVHDLESLRGGIQGLIRKGKANSEFADFVLLKQFDEIICHNKYMKEYLIARGIDENRLVCLEIFDYLCNCETKVERDKGNPSIAIAGNLSYGKCSYIYNIYGQDDSQNSNLTIYLYGDDFDESHEHGDMRYQGSFSPEELPGKLKGDFGLVWDGTSVDTCAGNTGEYLKYNNPHKTSLYLASGRPVIVWDKAAIADFVLKNNVGIAVGNLNHLDEIISDITDNDYKVMCENADKIGSQIRSGYYFSRALQKCMKKLRDNDQ